MRLTSEHSLKVLQHRLPELLRNRNDESSLTEIAQQLFEAGRVIAENAALRAAMADPSREPQDRAMLAINVFEPATDLVVADVVATAASLRWSEPGDMVSALRQLGVETVLAGAEERGVLEQVESEVFESIYEFRRNRDVRVKVLDEVYPLEARTALANEVFANALPETLVLIDQAIADSDGGHPLVSTLRRITALAAARANKKVASVWVATPITPQQEERLIAQLSKKYGSAISLHVVVDPSVVGGIRVSIGDDIFDSTLAARLKDAHKDMIRAQSALAQ